ncbi:MAG: bifunctional diaminohydroxyphosphoribosylaminopyrimidine deaminase/5-amino-6-(5-phosphoribosylamino)uracil reductase RibD [Aquiluna sp.]|jgi:diaminohydroxyphosphoribosylaminopyrimidine deaminase/5-amino-6-(5-phosphoribosylamino)uracil reductase
MPSVEQYEFAMRRALEISLNGPAVGINPQVGAVILDPAGLVVSEGWHKGAGSDHAEVMSLEHFAENFPGVSLKNHTAVVTLEPCNHVGRTGPCALALIEAGVSRVIFASADPGDQSSQGSQTLKDAGIEVIPGVLLKQAEEQNRVWLGSKRLGRPFVTLKWASTLDGRSAASDGTSQWISGPDSRADTHSRRTNADSILVGTSTAIADDPELTARRPDGNYFENQPIRIVLGESVIPNNLRLFNDRAKTIQIQTRDLNDALRQLWAQGIKHVFVEGGPKLASAFVAAKLVDEFIVYLSPMLLGGPNMALGQIGITNIEDAARLEVLETKQLGNDIFIRARSA